MDEFWGMSWKEFSIYRTAYTRNDLADWQKARRIAYTVYVMNSADKNKLSEQRFLGLASDEPEDRGRPLSIEEVQEAMKRYSKN